jgi:Fe-S oxidoreductase
MFKEEEKGDTRINTERSQEALATGATIIAAACPFCNTMLSDGVKLAEKEEQVSVVDVAELIATQLGK